MKTIIEARVKKQRRVNKNTIFFRAECNPRGPSVNAIIKRHENVLQKNTVLKGLFPTNLFIVVK